MGTLHQNRKDIPIRTEKRRKRQADDKIERQKKFL
jgi:hypothetical protein